VGAFTELGTRFLQMPLAGRVEHVELPPATGDAQPRG
jgi:hypothetical protein